MMLKSKSFETERLSCDIRPSSKIVHRGSKFNVHVSIKNNFDKPVRIIGRDWQLPPYLSFLGESPGNKSVKELQPGDSCALVYVIEAFGAFSFYRNTSRGFLSKFSKRPAAPAGETFLGMNLIYEKEEDEKEVTTHWQEIQASLNVYASPIEIYLGAIIGGVLGSYSRNPTLGYEHLLSGIIGFFLVLIAKRRSDVQIGVSIEDWVGGAIVGFSVGFLGSDYIEKLLPNA